MLDVGHTARATIPGQPALPRAVMVIAAAVVVVLLAFAGAYGFHRDELYFVIAGRHPDLGYVDQPPLTPLLSAAGVALLGATPVAIRILPALVVGACVLVAAAMARDMGGTRRAMEVAALTTAVSGLVLAGHIAATATYDILAWTLLFWLFIRIIRGSDPRLWLLVGLIGGIALMNKFTVALLPVSLGIGLLLERRWRLFRSPWPWAGVALALLIWAPNLAWQVAHDLPQLEMARSIAANTGAENREQLLILQLVFAGPLLFPVAILGMLRLIVREDARPYRAFAWGYLIALVLTWQQAGKAYYAVGYLPVLFAAGAIAVAGWLERGRRPVLRLGAFGLAAALSGALIAVLTLPVLPPAVLVSSGVHDFNNESGEQIGWPELVDQVTRVVAELPPDDRAGAVIITSNYAEAGALELLGTGLPPVYSGHNSYWDFGRPADGATVAVIIGGRAMPGIGDCTVADHVRNADRVPNEEYGEPISVCRRLPTSWEVAWPAYRHLN